MVTPPPAPVAVILRLEVASVSIPKTSTPDTP